MKRVLFIFLCTLFVINEGIAQQDSTAKEESVIYNIVEKTPEFPGGQDAMYHFIVANLKYPKKAINNNTQGRVIVKFVVDMQGNVIKAKVVKGIGDGCDEEALRVVRAMPKWTPASQNGKPVSVYFTLPFSFKLEKEKKSKGKK